MRTLRDEYRAYLMEMRALSKDSNGRDVYVELTHEESERYNTLSNPMMRSGTPEEEAEYMALDEKHNLARIQSLDDERIECTGNPVKS